MNLDLAVWLNLISTVAIVAALIFTALQVRQASIKRRDQAAVTVIQTTQSEGWTRPLELVNNLPPDATVADVQRAANGSRNGLPSVVKSSVTNRRIFSTPIGTNNGIETDFRLS